MLVNTVERGLGSSLLMNRISHDATEQFVCSNTSKRM